MQNQDGVWNLVDAADRKDTIKGKSLMTREDGTMRTLASVCTGRTSRDRAPRGGRGQTIDTTWAGLTTRSHSKPMQCGHKCKMQFISDQPA